MPSTVTSAPGGGGYSGYEAQGGSAGADVDVGVATV